MKILFFVLCFLFCSGSYAIPKTKKVSSKKVYSFQPLLIRGKRQFIKKARDMQVEGESIVSSELFFIKMDVEKRIFEEAEWE